MPEYVYVGQSDYVSLSREDFKRHDIDHDAVEITPEDRTVTLTKEAADFLASQEFQFLPKEKFDEMVEQRRAEAQAQAEAVAAAQVSLSDAQVAGAPQGPQTRVIPARPGADADRDTLAAYAWTNYQINTEDPEKLTKAQINKALDQAGATDEDQTVVVDQGDVPGDWEGEGTVSPAS